MTARWHFDPQDTPQQRYVLRTSSTAQRTRARFPVGTVVRARRAPADGPRGVVQRHVPGQNAQGGYLRVQWANGVLGRNQPITLMPVEEEETDAS